MAVKYTFEQATYENNLKRLEKLNAETKALWGKMNVAQMLAHLNVAYGITYNENLPKITGLKKFLLKLIVKKIVTSEKPFSKNGRTAPEFIIADNRGFTKEKEKLANYIKETFQKGETYFEGKENISFGSLSAKEWSNLFQKHLDHHFAQFGV